MQRILRFVVFSAFGALMLSGFQCASSELTTARNAMKKQDYVGAKTALTKMLATEPANCDALMMLGEANARLNDITGMVDAYRKVRTCNGLTPVMSNEVSIRLYNVWVVEYNEGIKAYNDAVTGTDAAKYDSAIAHLSAARELKPEFTEPLVLIGQAQEAKGDTNAALATYKSWWDAEKAGFDIAKTRGIVLGMNRQQALRTLGTPMQTKMDSVDGAVIYKDRYDIGGRDFLVFAAMDNGAPDAVIEGWTYAPSTTLSEPERMRSRAISMSPLKALAFMQYQRGKEEEALGWCDIVASAKPGDQELGPLRTQLYQNLGKTDQAVAELKAALQKDPDNAAYRVQYAGLLMAAERYDEAIAEYKTVLEKDPKNETALYNMAAVYKNKASKAQMAERDKLQKDKNYKVDETFLKDLGTSAEYFERLRETFRYRDDLTVLEQLANIYEVRREKSKVKAIIMELEALGEKYATNKAYYQIMEGVYARNGMVDKAKEMEAKHKTMK